MRKTRPNEPWSLKQIKKTQRLENYRLTRKKINPFSDKQEFNRERIAKHCHDVWSHWMKYLFEQCESTSFLNEIVEFVRNNPNDMELGKKVRQFVGENSELIVDYINRENQKYLKYMQE